MLVAVVWVLIVMLPRVCAFRLVGWRASYQSIRKSSGLSQAQHFARDDTRHAQEKLFTSISFFRFTNIQEEHIEEVTRLTKDILSKSNIKGTLLLSNEGFNGQFAVRTGTLPSFRSDLESVDSELFGNLDINVGKTLDYSDESLVFPFKRLIVRKKKGALTDGLTAEQAAGIDWSRPGPDMAPEKWHEAITASFGAAPLVLDCRNAYESDMGIFAGATPLNTAYFSETWDKLHNMLEGVDKNTPLLTYCTGGIRCVKVNAYLQQKMGFTNTHRLQGGIIAYEEWVHAQNQAARAQSTVQEANSTLCTLSGESHVDSADQTQLPSFSQQHTPVPVESCFKGENFLFDRRRLSTVGGDAPVVN